MALLVSDVSPWVEFFAGRECALLEAGLEAGIVEIPALVKIELLGNILSTKDRKSLEQVLEPLPILGLEPGHLQRAGRLKASLQEMGLAISARDAHILQCAKDREAILISNDPLFLRIQKSAGVRVQMW
jgi:predicted nucleic acid-binding protein